MWKSRALQASIVCFFLTFPNVVFGLEIKQKLYHVAAEPQSSAILSCQADSIPEKCSFTTPDGQVICYSEDAEYDPFGFGDYDESDKDNVDCTNGFEGLEITLDNFENYCQLEIESLDPNEHFGDWTCTISSFGGSSEDSAKIIVGKAQPALVEFETYFGDVSIDAGLQKVFPLTCNAISEDQDGEPLSVPPGEMSFEVGGTPIQDVTSWKSESGIWFKTANYNPDIYDNENTISCILKQGSEEISTDLTLKLSLFKFETETSKDMKDLEDGTEQAEFEIKFKAFPKIEASKMSWVIFDASDDKTTLLKLGDQNQGNFEVNSLQAESEPNTFVSYMRFKNIKHTRDADKTVSFQV